MSARAAPLGVLLGTDGGLYQLLPGEPLRCVLPDVGVTALDVRGGAVLAAAAGRGVWQHGGGGAADWRQVWEGDARAARTAPDGARYVGAAPAALLRAPPDADEWTPSPSLGSVVRYQRGRSRPGPGPSGRAAGRAADPALSAVAFPRGALLAAVDGAGVWLSGDGGRSWLPRSEGVDARVAALREHPEHGDRVYAVTAGGLFRSEDGGFSWLQSLSGLDRSAAHSAAVLPGAPDALVLAAARRVPAAAGEAARGGRGGALFRSLDGGLRWTRLALGADDEWPDPPLVAALPGSRDTVFAAAGRRVWASHDRGGEWRPLTDPADAAALPPVRALAAAL